MKKVAVIGAGYAGLAVSIGLAHCNAMVRCIDIDEKKIERLSQGNVTIHEPEMEGMLRRQLADLCVFPGACLFAAAVCYLLCV